MTTPTQLHVTFKLNILLTSEKQLWEFVKVCLSFLCKEPLDNQGPFNYSDSIGKLGRTFIEVSFH